MGTIKNGSGGDIARVDKEKRLHTRSFAVGSLLESALKAESYNVSSGLITVVDGDTDHAVLYIKNLGSEQIIIDGMYILLGGSTDGVGAAVVTYTFEPTAGTLISDANDAQTINRTIGDNSVIDITAYSPLSQALDKTITDGTDLQFPVQPGTTAPYFSTPLVLPQGASFGVKVRGPVGNTNMLIQIGAIVTEDGFLGLD